MDNGILKQEAAFSSTDCCFTSVVFCAFCVTQHLCTYKGFTNKKISMLSLLFPIHRDVKGLLYSIANFPPCPQLYL